MPDVTPSGQPGKQSIAELILKQLGKREVNLDNALTAAQELNNKDVLTEYEKDPNQVCKDVVALQRAASQAPAQAKQNLDAAGVTPTPPASQGDQPIDKSAATTPALPVPPTPPTTSFTGTLKEGIVKFAEANLSDTDVETYNKADNPFTIKVNGKEAIFTLRKGKEIKPDTTVDIGGKKFTIKPEAPPAEEGFNGWDLLNWNKTLGKIVYIVLGFIGGFAVKAFSSN